MKALREIISRHKAAQAVGICSACSAHPLVIEAVLRYAKKHDSVALIEATSNQVNQDGGGTAREICNCSGNQIDSRTRFAVPLFHLHDFPNTANRRQWPAQIVPWAFPLLLHANYPFERVEDGHGR